MIFYFCMKCHWCGDFYPIVGSRLCSYCNSLYETGKYTCGYHLRGRVDYREAGPPKKTVNPVTRYCVKHLVTFREEHKKLLDILGRLTPYRLWLFFYINGLWLSSEQAKLILENYSGYRYEHAVCCRVVDSWNILGGSFGIGECYYNRFLEYPENQEGVKLPVGRPISMVDLN